MKRGVYVNLALIAIAIMSNHSLAVRAQADTISIPDSIDAVWITDQAGSPETLQ